MENQSPTDATSPETKEVDRRAFLLKSGMTMIGGLLLIRCMPDAAEAASYPAGLPYDWTKREWGYAVDTTKCIGCGACMRACRKENDVPPEYYRTWVERFEISEDGKVHVDVAMNETATFSEDATAAAREKKGVKAFFVPKLCNHCKTSVCTQVCPVGATFHTPDGVVLVDGKHCVGCGYCIQACPYGTRFLNPKTHTADKCTLCYHRITKGLKPACVQSCPVGARIFGDLKDPESEISHVLREHRYNLLKPELGTNPRCFYIGLDREVK